MQLVSHSVHIVINSHHVVKVLESCIIYTYHIVYHVSYFHSTSTSQFLGVFHICVCYIIMMYCLHLMLEGYSDIYMCTCMYVYGIVPSAPRSLDANFLALILNPGSVTTHQIL